MPEKPTHEELEQRVMEIEKEAAKPKRADESLKIERDRFQALIDRLARKEVELLIKQLMSF